MDSIERVPNFTSDFTTSFDLANAFYKIEHNPTPKGEAAFRKRVEDFINDMDDLYDVFNKHEQH